MSVHELTMARLVDRLDRPVMQNALRSMYVEHQVEVLLGDQWTLVGTDWGGWDFKSLTGHRLELKQAAAKQSWAQSRPSRASFDVAPRTGRYEGAEWISGGGRFADVYVFAWHYRWDDDADQRDETQWEYYVVPTERLPLQKTVSLSKLRSLVAPTDAGSLCTVVDETARLTRVAADGRGGSR